MVRGFTSNDVQTLSKYMNKWIRAGLSTCATVHESAEDAIYCYYEQLGLATPKIIWCNSPLSLVLNAVCSFNETGSWIDEPLVPELLRQSLLFEQIAASITIPEEQDLQNLIAQTFERVLSEALSLKPVRPDGRPFIREASISPTLDRILSTARSLKFRKPFFSAGVQAVVSVLTRNFARNRKLAIYDLLRNERQFHKETKLFALESAFRESAGSFVLFKNVAFMCKKPVSIRFDRHRRSHDDSYLAFTYPDGWEVSCTDGNVISKSAIMPSNQITLNEIKNQSGPVREFLIAHFGATRYDTIRRIDTLPNGMEKSALLEEFGLTNYWLAHGAKAVQTDEFGTLFRINQVRRTSLVRVINSTAEPDGTFKEYFLKVPSTLSTARQAVAWTFGLEMKEYRPDRES